MKCFGEQKNYSMFVVATQARKRAFFTKKLSDRYSLKSVFSLTLFKRRKKMLADIQPTSFHNI